MAPAPTEHVVELPRAGVPADRGLSALGLLMQLAGGALAAAGVLGGLVAMLALARREAVPDGAGWVLAIAGLCVARSLVHRAAGARLLYGGRQRPDGSTASPLEGVRAYIAVAAGQTLLCALVGYAELGMSGAQVLAWSAGLAVWPLALSVALGSGALARFEAGIPHAEDKGFEGAAVLLTVLGAAGVLATAAALAAELGAGLDSLLGDSGFVVAGALAFLLARAGLQLRAGLSGLRETAPDLAADLASRYAAFGVVSTFWLGGVMLLGAMSQGLSVWGMALVAALCWLMMVWPLAVRRFFQDRQFVDLLAGEFAALHRRAPDAGLAGLGWLLLGHAALTASLLVPRLIAGPELGDAWWPAALAAGVGDGSPWWSAGVIVLEAWAGTELVRMGAHHRLLAIVYGAAGTLVALTQLGPVARRALELTVLGPGGERLALSLPPIAIHLTLPVAAVLLATRSIAPAARARYRGRR